MWDVLCSMVQYIEYIPAPATTIGTYTNNHPIDLLSPMQQSHDPCTTSMQLVILRTVQVILRHRYHRKYHSIPSFYDDHLIRPLLHVLHFISVQ